jgi:hypothetical protein
MMSPVYAFGQFGPEIQSTFRVDMPSPTATSMAKFEAFPVDHYTGLPSVSIPLVTLESRHMRVPVALNYHGGIKVQDRASWVGLGWSLQAGGVITRVARGWPDDEPFGFLSNADYVQNNIFSLSSEFLTDIADGMKNAEPDLYTITGPGLSGQFIFYDEDKVIFLSHQNVDIQVQKDHQETITGFIVTGEDGIEYVYDSIENTSSYETSSGTDIPPGKSLLYTSSWYLSSMSYPSGDDQITFHYQNSIESGNTSTRSHSFWKRINMPGYQCSSTGVDAEGWKTTISDTPPVYLESIVVNDSLRVVEFDLASRTDLSAESRLQWITVREKGVRKQAFELKETYSSGTYPRMLLDSLIIQGISSSDKLPGYGFTY